MSGISGRQFKHVADIANFLSNHADELGIREMTPHAEGEGPSGVYELDLFPMSESTDTADAIQEMKEAVHKAVTQTAVGVLANGDRLFPESHIEVSPAG
jgi:glutamine synthetase